MNNISEVKGLVEELNNKVTYTDVDRLTLESKEAIKNVVALFESNVKLSIIQEVLNGKLPRPQKIQSIDEEIKSINARIEEIKRELKELPKAPTLDLMLDADYKDTRLQRKEQLKQEIRTCKKKIEDLVEFRKTLKEYIIEKYVGSICPNKEQVLEQVKNNCERFSEIPLFRDLINNHFGDEEYITRVLEIVKLGDKNPTRIELKKYIPEQRILNNLERRFRTNGEKIDRINLQLKRIESLSDEISPTFINDIKQLVSMYPQIERNKKTLSVLTKRISFSYDKIAELEEKKEEYQGDSFFAKLRRKIELVNIDKLDEEIKQEKQNIEKLNETKVEIINSAPYKSYIELQNKVREAIEAVQDEDLKNLMEKLFYSTRKTLSIVEEKDYSENIKIYNTLYDEHFLNGILQRLMEEKNDLEESIYKQRKTVNHQLERCSQETRRIINNNDIDLISKALDVSERCSEYNFSPILALELYRVTVSVTPDMKNIKPSIGYNELNQMFDQKVLKKVSTDIATETDKKAE